MRRRGFTLVEMLVVIAIVAVLAGVLFAGFRYAVGASRWNVTEGRVQALGNQALLNLRLKGVLPSALIELQEAIDQPGWIDGGQFVDAYGRPIQYAVSAGAPRVWSMGEDGVSGTADDIEYRKR